MPGRTQTTTSPADNRCAYHEGKAERAQTARERLSAYLGWVMTEAKRLPEAEVDDVVDRVAGIAQELNERSRS